MKKKEYLQPTSRVVAINAAGLLISSGKTGTIEQGAKETSLFNSEDNEGE